MSDPVIDKLKATVKTVLSAYPRWVNRREFDRQRSGHFNERPVEYGFVFRQLAKRYPKSVLDVGTGTTALPHLMNTCGFVVTAVDNVSDYWPAGMFNRHYHVLDDDITRSKLDQRFEAITCISTLEHILDHETAMKNMLRLLEPGGHLLLTCPYSDHQYVPNVYELPTSAYGQDAPYVCQSYSRKELNGWLEASDAELVEQELWRFWEGEFWTQGKRILPPEQVEVGAPHQISCMAIRRRP